MPMRDCATLPAPQPGGRTLLLVRHAAPHIAPGICYGRLDIRADDAATGSAAAMLALRLPPAARIVTSPLLRCRQLADALHALRPDLLAVHDPCIAEMDFGTWEGRAWDAIGRTALDAWTADFAHHAPGGGETVQQVLARVRRALDRAVADTDADPVVWITHAGVARAVQLLCEGVSAVRDAAQWPREGLAFGELREWRLPPQPVPAT